MRMQNSNVILPLALKSIPNASPVVCFVVINIGEQFVSKGFGERRLFSLWFWGFRVAHTEAGTQSQEGKYSCDRNHFTSANREYRVSNDGIFPELRDTTTIDPISFLPEELHPPTEGRLPATGHLHAARSRRVALRLKGAGRKRVAQNEFRRGKAFCDRT